MEINQIKVQVKVHGNLERVWEYWNTPEHIMKWNFASPEWHCPAAYNDLKKGGRFRYTMAARDESMSFEFEGNYIEVHEPHMIRAQLSDGRNISVQFLSEGDSTLIVEDFDPDISHSRDLQQAGWQAILENFKSYIEAT